MLVVGCGQSQQNCKFSLNLDDQIGLVKADLQGLVVPRKLGDERGVRPAGIGLGASLVRCLRRKVSCLTLTVPSAQGGGIDPFTAQQRADLTGLGAPVHSLKNTAFGGVGKTAPTRVRPDLRIEGRHLRRRRRFSSTFTHPIDQAQ